VNITLKYYILLSLGNTIQFKNSQQSHNFTDFTLDFVSYAVKAKQVASKKGK
jgi:hypothetical protein